MRLLLLALFLPIACRTMNGGGSRESDEQLPTPEPSAALPTKPASEMPIVAQIASSGDWMCLGFGSLWEPSGGLKRVDPVEHKVKATITEAAGNFCHASPEENALWVASVFAGKIMRVDPATNTVTKTFQVPITSGTEGSFTVTKGGIWVITNRGTPPSNSGTLTRLNPENGEVLADVRVADGSHGIVDMGDFVWVTSSTANNVTQVSIGTNAIVNTIPVSAGPRFIAAGEKGVWVLSQGTGKVDRLDPISGQVVATIDTKTPGFGGGIAAAEGGAWVTTFGKPVTKIDPATNQVVVQYVGNGFGDAIEAGEGFVWVSGGKLTQIKP